MCRTAMAWGSAAAHNLAAYSQSDQGFATNFNMYPGVQQPSTNGSLGHTRGQVNCAIARWKSLIHAVVPVYFVWNKKSHISNGTAKSVGSHSVSNTRSSGISVDDCAQSAPPPQAGCVQVLLCAGHKEVAQRVQGVLGSARNSVGGTCTCDLGVKHRTTSRAAMGPPTGNTIVHWWPRVPWVPTQCPKPCTAKHAGHPAPSLGKSGPPAAGPSQLPPGTGPQ